MTAAPRGFAPVAVAFAILMASHSPAPAAGAGWYTDYPSALAAARKTGKPIFAEFSTSWCSACKTLEATSMRDPEVTGRLDDFIKVHIDGDANMDMVSSWNVSGYPTMVTLSPGGREVGRMVGAVNAGTIANNLDRAASTAAPAAEKPERAVASGGNEADAETPDDPGAQKLAEIEAKRRAEKASAAVLAKLDRKWERDPSVNFYTGGSAPTKRTVTSAPRIETVAAEGASPLDALAGTRTIRTVAAAAPPVRIDSAVGGAGSASLARQAAASTRRPAKMSVSMPYPMASPMTGAARDTVIAADTVRPLLNAGSTRDGVAAGADTEEAAPRAKPAAASPGAKEEMPRPRQASAPAPTAAKPAADQATADPLATIRKLQVEDDSPAAAKPGATDDESNLPASGAKTTPATAGEIAAMMKDANKKLLEGRKKEAGSAYFAIVKRDPSNQFGMSDTAFIKGVSLIVDADDDALRRKAHNMIKEFDKRFPNSTHRDYYTVIRATLAADLGETEEAARLLYDFPERFKDSRYSEMAYKMWNEVKSAAPKSASKPAARTNAAKPAAKKAAPPAAKKTEAAKKAQ